MKADVGRSAVVGGVLGVLFFLAGLAGIVLSKGLLPWSRLLTLLGASLGIAALLPALLGAMSVLRIRLADGQVVQLVGPWPVASKPVAEVTAVRLGGRLFPVVLVFRDGRRMRVLAMHLGARIPFATAVQREAPHVVVA